MSRTLKSLFREPRVGTLHMGSPYRIFSFNTGLCCYEKCFTNIILTVITVLTNDFFHTFFLFRLTRISRVPIYHKDWYEGKWLYKNGKVAYLPYPMVSFNHIIVSLIYCRILISESCFGHFCPPCFRPLCFHTGHFVRECTV